MNGFTFTFMLCLMAEIFAWAQPSGKGYRYFSDPIITDSSSTVVIPTTYDMELFVSNKSLTWGNYYANIVVYNFATDSYFKLFKDDTFIHAFATGANSMYQRSEEPKLDHLSEHWIFYLVKSSDHNGNGKVDDKDPSMLYVTDRKGMGLKSLTLPNENVVSFKLYEKLGFALAKLQQDSNGDRDFQHNDKSFTMMKIDLTTLKCGNKIALDNVSGH